jgi:hypothetical protein
VSGPKLAFTAVAPSPWVRPISFCIENLRFSYVRWHSRNTSRWQRDCLRAGGIGLGCRSGHRNWRCGCECCVCLILLVIARIISATAVRPPNRIATQSELSPRLRLRGCANRVPRAFARPPWFLDGRVIENISRIQKISLSPRFESLLPMGWLSYGMRLTSAKA